MGIILSGKEVAKFYRNEIKKEVEAILSKTGKKPGIACVLVGDDPASQVYVNSKEKTAAKLGFHSLILRLSSETTEVELLGHLQRLNSAANIDGILVQLPLPNHINEEKIILSIKPDKDVDVFHPQNIGALWNGSGALAPCTPLGIINILKYYNLPLKGKRTVVVGRSNIVGKPMACLLLREHATVTICHSRTVNLEAVCKEADVLIGAIGRSRFINKNFVKKNAVLVDVGMNRLDDGTLTGDMDFEVLKDYASAITPVPGGVGPMTIAMLMLNTLTLFKEHHHVKENTSL